MLLQRSSQEREDQVTWIGSLPRELPSNRLLQFTDLGGQGRAGEGRDGRGPYAYTSDTIATISMEQTH